MSVDKDAMLAAIGTMNTALQTFATAHADYAVAQRAASATALAHPYKNQQFLIEAVAGLDKLDIQLVMRMRSLGLGGLLDQARSDDTLADLSALTSKISAIVP